MDSWVLPLALVVIAALAFTLQRMRHTQRQQRDCRASSARKQAVRTRISPAAAL